MRNDKADHEPSRRRFVKKAAYIAPAVLSLAVAPSYAKAGSNKGRPVRRIRPIRRVRP
jgi:hypothetical protein